MDGRGVKMTVVNGQGPARRYPRASRTQGWVAILPVRFPRFQPASSTELPCNCMLLVLEQKWRAYLR